MTANKDYVGYSYHNWDPCTRIFIMNCIICLSEKIFSNTRYLYIRSFITFLCNDFLSNTKSVFNIVENLRYI